MTAPLLTPLAVSHADVLRFIHLNLNPPASKIAEATERVASNVKRDLAKLAEAGLLYLEPLVLSDAGVEMIAALDRAESRGTAPGDLLGGRLAMLRHDQIVPDPENARETFDPEELQKLADTLFSHGMKQKPSVMPEGKAGKHQLTMGERRWRAWGMNIEQGRWPADHVEPCWIDEAPDEEQRIEGGLIENLQRADLNHVEIGKAFEALATRYGRKNRQIADRLGRSAEFVQQHRRIMQLTDTDLERVRSGDLSFHDALRQLAKPKEKPIPPTALLALAEIALRIHLEHGEVQRWKDISIQLPGPSDQDLVDTLITRVAGIERPRKSYSTLQVTTQLSWSGPDQLAKLIPDFAADPAAAIARLRLECGLQDPGEGVWSTVWLNGPFDLSAEDKAELQQREERREADRQREAAAKAAQAKVRADLNSLSSRVKKESDGHPCSPELQPALEGTGVVLPLSFKSGDIIDATGKRIATSSYYSNTGLDRDSALRVLCIAVNAAVGFAKSCAVAPPKDAAEATAVENQIDIEDAIEAQADEGVEA